MKMLRLYMDPEAAPSQHMKATLPNGSSVSYTHSFPADFLRGLSTRSKPKPSYRYLGTTISTEREIARPPAGNPDPQPTVTRRFSGFASASTLASFPSACASTSTDKRTFDFTTFRPEKTLYKTWDEMTENEEFDAEDAGYDEAYDSRVPFRWDDEAAELMPVPHPDL